MTIDRREKGRCLSPRGTGVTAAISGLFLNGPDLFYDDQRCFGFDRKL